MNENRLEYSETFEQNTGKKLNSEFVYSDKTGWPKSVDFEGNTFEFRHDNPEQANAVYVRRLEIQSPVRIENLAVDTQGNVLLHRIYDERDSENWKANPKNKV